MSLIADPFVARRTPVARRIRAGMPYVLLAIMLVVFFVLPEVTGNLTSSFNLFNALQMWSSVGLLALGIGLTMIAGEFDLGALGTYAVAGMVAIKVGENGAVLGIAAALAVGLGVGLAQGLIIARLRINSMPVTLGFYIALLGATAAISNSQSVSFSNFEVGATLDAAKLELLSWRSLIAIGVYAAVIVVMRFTPVGREIRAIGGDRRASRVVGVQVDRRLVGVFVTSSFCAALGGSLLAYSLATAIPDPGTQPMTFAVTAVLIGGVSLVGGTGNALGIACGALVLSLLQELFSVLAAPNYLESIVTGALLLVATVLAAPELRARWKSLQAPRVGRGSQAAPPATPGERAHGGPG